MADPLALARPGSAAQPQATPLPELARVRAVTRLLDHHMVDPLLGLVLPGVGDLIGSMLGFYVVAIAVRRKVSPVVIARMLLNLAFDAAIGFVPVIGDLADLGFKAHAKNLALLTTRHETGQARARDWLAVGGALLAFVAVVGLVIYALVAVLGAII